MKMVKIMKLVKITKLKKFLCKKMNGFKKRAKRIKLKNLFASVRRFASVKLSRKVIISLGKREFFEFLNSALVYVVTVPFLVLSSFLFFRIALISGEANLGPFLDLLPWFFLFLSVT